MKKYYTVYQITNKINNMIYIGCHATNNPLDSYMGSGTNIKKAINEFGLENFEKIILYKYDNKEDMLKKEKELVNYNFISNKNTYNIILGGGQFNVLNTVTVKDKNNNTFQVHKEDPRYLSGELKHINVNYITVKNKDGETFRVHKEDPRYLSGELKHITKDMFTALDKNGNILHIHKEDPRYLSGELKHITKNTFTAIDKNGNIYKISNDDPRYLNGELTGIVKGKINVKDKNGNTLQVSIDDDRYLSGELIHCTKSMITVKDKNGNTFNVFADDERYLSGELQHIWKGKKHNTKTREKMSKSAKGRQSHTKGMIWITEKITGNRKMIKKTDLEKYINNGWYQKTKGKGS